MAIEKLAKKGEEVFFFSSVFSTKKWEGFSLKLAASVHEIKEDGFFFFLSSLFYVGI